METKYIIVVIIIISIMIIFVINSNKNNEHFDATTTTSTNEAVQNIASLYANKDKLMVLNNLNVTGETILGTNMNYKFNDTGFAIKNNINNAQLFGIDPSGNINTTGNINTNGNLNMKGNFSVAGGTHIVPSGGDNAVYDFLASGITISSGYTKWFLHVPPNKQKLIIAPIKTDNSDWNWAKQFNIDIDGNVEINGNLKVNGDLTVNNSSDPDGYSRFTLGKGANAGNALSYMFYTGNQNNTGLWLAKSRPENKWEWDRARWD
jgi:competence protein ComGC